MDSRKHLSIRKAYYGGTLLIILIMAVSISLPFFTMMKGEYDRKTELLAQSVLNQKKNYIQSVIQEKVRYLEEEEKTFLEQAEAFAGQAEKYLISLYSDGTYPEPQDLNGGIIPEYFDYQLLDRRSGKILHSSLPGPVDQGEDIWRRFSYPLSQRYGIVLLLNRERAYGILKARAEENIRSTTLPDKGYIWVNRILDYNGGDGYAIRLIHPNLPETEGMLLSTSMEDKAGNKPYLKELEGIKREGRVFHDYYFQKTDSPLVSHKLSFAMLYEKYDWIISTGVYLDDIDALVKEESAYLTHAFSREIRLILIITAAAMSAAVLIMVSFEKRLNRIVDDYTTNLEKMNARLWEEKQKIQELASLDPLTGLFNRRAMSDRLKSEADRFARENAPFCLVMADLDRFKGVNDRYGHETGDLVLKETAGLLKDSLRKTDTLSRWGGEEFLIILCGVERPEGMETAEKIRRLIQKKRFAGPEGEDFSITLTLGLIQFDGTLSMEEAINRADENLYKGKQSGRNRVVG